MKIMSSQDYKLFERLVSLSQGSLKETMAQYLKPRYDKIIHTQDYIVAIGDIPIALVAHMDTVFKEPVQDMYYDQQKGVIWSPEGIGGDDRCGIFAIIKIIQSGLRPSIILTTDEEKGGLGAAALAEKKCPIPGLKYMIELDRRGTNDCVFYDCYCPEFSQYVSSFGFCEAYGSFSDISFLMGAWEICGVNLSVGYHGEHSETEIVKIAPLYDTIRKVKNMLNEKNIPDFKFEELDYMKYLRAYYMNADFGTRCDHCKGLFPDDELFPVKGKDGTLKMYCTDCVIGNVNWCSVCGEAFELTKATDLVCKDCRGGKEKCSVTSKNNSKK